MFLAGYGLLLVVYLAAARARGGRRASAVCIALFGAYYAATEGVLMAIASALLPAELRGTGLGLLVTATSLARVLGTIGFGALWASSGPRPRSSCSRQVAVLLAAAALSFLYLRKDRDVGPARA